MKHGWSKADSPPERSGCPSSEQGMQQALEKSLLGNTYTKQQKANLRFECCYPEKEGNTHGDIPGSKLVSLQNKDRGILKPTEAS